MEKRGESEKRGHDTKLDRAHGWTTAMTEEILEVEAEIDERVKGLYGL